jgi:hypothetical protein
MERDSAPSAHARARISPVGMAVGQHRASLERRGRPLERSCVAHLQ